MTARPIDRRVGATSARHPGEGGFTLVEVMVALMIFGMIAAAGVAILSFSIRAQAASATRLDDASAFTRTLTVLSADLAQATTRPTRDEGGTLRPAFVGEGTQVALVRGGWTNIDAAPRASEQKVVWRLDGTTLQRIAYPQLDGAAPLGATPMLTRVAEMRLRFRYAGVWSDRWDGGDGLPVPEAMELTMARTDGTRYRAMFLVGTGYAPMPAATPSPTPTAGSSVGASDAPR
ncbi:type II secretion system minor pseudopilin GspJ [Sphingomonas rubra]|uniref:Type II secretion system protein J n=1 Tax=Sphingomonas rubra TaxID=634430 RepID=A0A1I5SUK9_9SPHN|nr:type II secretion system minor pseudopilin GspJ [Sphingomonas rubra]SFP74368.1 general secretion pathway protein J [Sphingomonas rubra]